MAIGHFTEVIFPDDFEQAKRIRLVERSPYSVVEHPFRVIVHDSEFHLVAIGTTELGEGSNPYSEAQAYAKGWLACAMAIVLSRSTNEIIHTIVKPIGEQHASTHHYRR